MKGDGSFHKNFHCCGTHLNEIESRFDVEATDIFIETSLGRSEHTNSCAIGLEDLAVEDSISGELVDACSGHYFQQSLLLEELRSVPGKAIGQCGQLRSRRRQWH